ncbi:MAG: chorismate mutase [Bacteroidota bacterium]
MIISPEQWGFPQKNKPWIISGPCGAESAEQVMITARGVKESGAHALRAGIWKPRTRPGSFEGMGEQALSWLREAGDETGLPVMVEVASAKHVEAALKSKIDFLWLGARTTVNPFLVQEIADSLNGVDIPVFIKNPVNPDLALWLGAIERIERSGITKIAAIHRGFSSYENSVYRNKPNWEIPIELKRKMPSIAMFCDPSHICGSPQLLGAVSQLALDLQFDGLMIESHYNPEIALSDKNQQLTPADLKDLIASLSIRKAEFDCPVELSRLQDLRDTIDEIDFEILNKMASRMDVARKIGEYKFLNNVAIYQSQRWAEIIASRTALGEEKGLSPEFILKLYNMIHEESILQQTNVVKNDAGEVVKKSN